MAVFLLDGSRAKQCRRKSLNSGVMASGKGGNPSFAILNMAVIEFKLKYGGCPVIISSIVHPKDLSECKPLIPYIAC